MRKESVVLTPKIDRPIDTLTLAILREVRDVATELGLEMFLMGATARIILLEYVYGLRTGRATRDVDFAFAVENWSQFQSVKQRLIATSRFEAIERVEQRLLYKPAGIEHKFAVDIIPFGGLAGANNMIAWPPDMSFLMSVAGYADVQASAVKVEVEPRLVISIASIPGLATLKLFAWLDRGQEDPKDAIDLVT